MDIMDAGCSWHRYTLRTTRNDLESKYESLSTVDQIEKWIKTNDKDEFLEVIEEFITEFYGMLQEVWKIIWR